MTASDNNDTGPSSEERIAAFFASSDGAEPPADYLDAWGKLEDVDAKAAEIRELESAPGGDALALRAKRQDLAQLRREHARLLALAMGHEPEPEPATPTPEPPSQLTQVNIAVQMSSSTVVHVELPPEPAPIPETPPVPTTEPASTAPVKRKREDALAPLVRKAQGMAADPESASEVFTILKTWALSDKRPSPLLGLYKDGDAIQWEDSNGNTSSLNRAALAKRIKRHTPKAKTTHPMRDAQ